MTALIALSMLAAAFLCAGAKHRLAELDRAQRFARRMKWEAQLDQRLANRKAQRQVRNERAKRGWNTRRAA